MCTEPTGSAGALYEKRVALRSEWGHNQIGCSRHSHSEFIYFFPPCETANTAAISAGGTLVIRELFSQLSPVVGLANGANGSQLRARTRLAVAAKEIKSISGTSPPSPPPSPSCSAHGRVPALPAAAISVERASETPPPALLIWPRLEETRALESLLLR